MAVSRAVTVPVGLDLSPAIASLRLMLGTLDALIDSAEATRDALSESLRKLDTEEAT